MTYTAPKAAVRTYNGSAQQIVSGQSAGGGSIYYATSSAGASSSTTVPTATNTGTTYSTYWRAVPDGNHSGGTSTWAQITNCTINKAALTITAKAQTINYGGSITTGVGQVTTSGLVGGDSLTSITLTPSTSNVPGGVITPSAGATTKGIGNYSVTYSTGVLTINKVAMTYTAPKATTYTYDNGAWPLVSGASANGGSIQYSTAQTGTYSTTIPGGTNAGTYVTWWKAVPDSNHSGGTNAASISTTINCYTATAPTNKNPNWTGSAIAYANAGLTNYGTMVYSTTSGGSFTALLPTATNAGSYDCWWKVTGNTNVCNTTPAKVSCSIAKVAMSYTAPKAATRTYTGSAQQIVSGGSATGGSIQFCSTSGGTYSTTVPTQTNASTSYSTWWKAVPDSNHSGGTSAAQITNCTINPAPCCSTAPSATNYVYNGSARNLVSGGSSSCGTMKYSIHGNPPANVVYYEYIENTSTSYIDTEYTIGPSNLKNIKLYIDFVATANQVGNRWWAHGLGGSSSLTVYAGIGNGASGDSIRFTYGNGTNDITTSVYGNIGTRYKYLLDLKNKTYNVINESGVVLVDLTNITVNTPSSSYSPYIFAWRRGSDGTLGSSHSDKIYSFKLYDNDVLVRDLVPCTYNGTAGMWDKVGNKFYGNKGGGSFTLGNLDWSTTIPNGICATTYTTYWKVDNDANHSGTCSGSVSTTIAKAAITCTAPTAKSLTYSRGSQALVNAGSVGGGSMQYSTAQTGTYSTTIPSGTNAGSYSTWYKAEPDSNHSGSCSGKVDTTIAKATPVLNASPSCTTVTFNNANQNLLSGGTMKHSASDATAVGGTFTYDTGKNAGTYSKPKWYFTPNSSYSGNYNSTSAAVSCTATINKASGSVSLTPNILTYNGSSQALLTVSNNTGTMHYSDGRQWTTNIPSGTNVNQYTIQWYMDASTNYNGLFSSGSPASVNAAISCANPTFTAYPAAKTGLVYAGSQQELLSGGTANVAGTFSYGKGTTAGTYTNVSWTFTPTNRNYCENTGRVASVTIAPAPITCTAPTAKTGLVYSRGAQALVNAGSVGGGSMQYSTAQTGTYSTTIPSGTNAGSYTVWYKAVPDSNHSGSCSGSVACSIAKATPVTATAPTKHADWTYNGSTYNLASGGSMKHSSSDATAVAGSFAYATGKNAGSYNATWTFTPTDTTNYNSVIDIAGTVIVSKANRTITFTTKPTSVNVSESVSIVASTTSDGTWTWTSSNNNIVSLSGSGDRRTASGVADGTATITASISANDNYNSASTSYILASLGYNKQYFTMKVTTGGNIKWSGSTTTNTLSYSKNNGSWTTVGSADTISAAAGDKIRWKGTATGVSASKGIGRFSADTTVRFDVEGNAMSLLFGDNFSGQTSLSGKDYAFVRLLSGSTIPVVNAKNLSLPATTLSNCCYDTMFGQNKTITTAPMLPATSLATRCYNNMFNGCSSLTAATSSLPATSLEERCYYQMFRNCSGLTTTPTISATSMAPSACTSMFCGCTSLRSAPTLPATTLETECYREMFSGCTSLTTVPTLLATTMGEYSCQYMFDGCTSLTTAPVLCATTMAEGCCENMFSECTSLTTIPSNMLPATNLSNGYSCYAAMFYGCTSLTTVPSNLLSATTLESGCYIGMFEGCTSLTTVPNNMLPATTLAEECYSYMFEGCTSLTTAPSLPATTLASNCYDAMFYGCTRLTTAPVLSATTLANYCYQYMFRGCTSLTTAPVLSATTLANNCYNSMFSGCSSLNTITCLATNTGATNCTQNWVNGVAASGTFIKDDSADWTIGVNGIPTGWSVEGKHQKKYFTTIFTIGGNIKWSGSTTANTLSYSKNNGSWTTVGSADTISVSAGDSLRWKGTPTPQTNKGIGRFSGDTTARYNVEGNSMSLLYGDNFSGQTSLSGKNYAFQYLFSGCTGLISAENLPLLATTLATNCYQGMFRGCTSLTTAPSLPATTLATYCYSYMFHNCTNLTTAPTLPATTLATYCYSYMFRGCTRLATAPSTLPATTLETYCYQGMFYECTSLATAPSTLPATTLASGCYSSMFYGCTSLTTAPSLPATTLVINCYQGMFRGCTRLTTAPTLPATTLVSYCYNNMFYGCTSLNYIKAMFTTTPSASYTTNWVNGVASSGTFVKNSAATWTTTGTSGIPTGWTVETASS